MNRVVPQEKLEALGKDMELSLTTATKQKAAVELCIGQVRVSGERD